VPAAATIAAGAITVQNVADFLPTTDEHDGLAANSPTAANAVITQAEFDAHVTRHETGGVDVLTDLPSAATLAGGAITVANTASHVGGLSNPVDANHVNRPLSTGIVADGTSDGKIKTTATIYYTIHGQIYTKTATDDLWDLSGMVDTGGAEYKAYRLCLNAGGSASVVESSVQATASAAHGALAAASDTVCQVAEYIANPNCDFNGIAGLAAQGTQYDGIANV
ncbi:MAG: hypothetical protein KKB59_18695, partial [Spirochaetes bacterium]|nr:hypothetical protein [Spirochaetota bacterium]